MWAIEPLTLLNIFFESNERENLTPKNHVKNEVQSALGICPTKKIEIKALYWASFEIAASFTRFLNSYFWKLQGLLFLVEEPYFLV